VAEKFAFYAPWQKIRVENSPLSRAIDSFIDDDISIGNVFD
jgi:hypothetical protein